MKWFITEYILIEMFDTKLGVIVLKRTVEPKQKIQLLIYMLENRGTVSGTGGTVAVSRHKRLKLQI